MSNISSHEIGAYMRTLEEHAPQGLSLRYKGSSIPNGGDCIDLENEQFLGNIVAWSSGLLDWTIYRIDDGLETVGHTSFDSVAELRTKVEAVLQSLK